MVNQSDQEGERITITFGMILSFYRPPPQRKSKDANSIKRVRAKRPATKNDDEQNVPVEDKGDVIEEQQVSDLG